LRLSAGSSVYLRWSVRCGLGARGAGGYPQRRWEATSRRGEDGRVDLFAGRFVHLRPGVRDCRLQLRTALLRRAARDCRAGAASGMFCSIAPASLSAWESGHGPVVAAVGPAEPVLVAVDVRVVDRARSAATALAIHGVHDSPAAIEERLIRLWGCCSRSRRRGLPCIRGSPCSSLPKTPVGAVRWRRSTRRSRGRAPGLCGL